MDKTRTERDTLGPVQVPDARLWGAQTQRSLELFRISREKMPEELLHALAQVKRSCAQVNRELGLLDERLARAIEETGSGTQTNMNMNEVLANRASELLGGERGERRQVHPNDHVNRGQSSNDVFPTALHVAAAVGIERQLRPAVSRLRDALRESGARICRMPSR